MLLMPVVVAVGVVGLGLPGLLYSLAVVGLFLARYPVELAVRRRTVPGAGWWLLIYAAVSGVAGLFLVATYGRWGLVPLGGLAVVIMGLYLWLIRRRAERTAPAELVMVAGLSLSAAGAVYAAGGEWTALALWLWLLTALYSGSSVFFVRMMVRRPPRGRVALGRRLRVGWGALLYQGLVWLALSALVVRGAIPLLLPLAFLPLLVKVVVGLFVVEGRPRIRVLGFMEVGHTLLFALLLVAAYRWL
jgi:hypothetical protein